MARMAAKESALDQRIAKRIRTLRLAAELSQAEIGKFIGVSYQQVQKFETGKSRISVSQLLKITQKLGCSISDVCNGIDGQKIGDGMFGISPEAVKVAKAFDAIAAPETRAAMARAIAAAAACS